MVDLYNQSEYQVTFVTHLRYDSDDRVKNLQKVLNFYSFYFPNSKFVLVEDSFSHNVNFDKIKFPPKTAFYFLENSQTYHRTKALNYGMFNAATDIVVSLDTDCIVSPHSLELCFEQIKTNKAAIAWPYNGFFVDVAKTINTADNINNNLLYNIFLKEFLTIDKPILGQTFGNLNIRCTSSMHKSVGGIVVFDKSVFNTLGGYNEKFIGWGAEDNEIDIRFNTLKFPSFRDNSEQSICFHLSHDNAVRHLNPFYQQNYDEVIKVENMSKYELENYIKSWKWKP